MSLVRFSQGWRQREVMLVLALGLISLFLWRIPFLGVFFYPFHLFGTFVHEISHGMAAVATGGDFQRFAVNPDLSGTAQSRGGVQWIISSAGYVGSAIFGGLLVVLSAWGAPARSVLFWLGMTLGLLCLLFVRNFFGIFTGLAIAASLVFAGQRLNSLWADGLLLFLAVQMMLNAMNSLFDLVLLATSAPRVTTDAVIMANATGIPAVIWAVLWTGISLICLTGSLYVAYRRAPTLPAEQSVVV